MRTAKIFIVLLSTILISGFILAGCKGTTNASSSTPSSNSTNSSSSAPASEEKTPVKTNNTQLVGAWQREVDEIAVLELFRADGTCSILNSEGVQDYYYEATEKGSDIYNVTFYDININLSGEKAVLEKGSKLYTILVGIKDKDTIQLTYEGSADLIEAKRISQEMAESMIGYSIFSEDGATAVAVTKNYLEKHKDEKPYSKLSYYYLESNTGGNSDTKYYIFTVTYQNNSISNLYVTSDDLRLLTENEI